MECSKPGFIWATIVLMSWLILNSCSLPASRDKAAPTIENITTSSKVLAKSDCIPTSLTITAQVIDDSHLQNVTLWYRVGADQHFAPMNMEAGTSDQFTAKLIALEIPGGEYGALEFYIVAQDSTGNETRSAIDNTVQLLACVAS